MRVIALDFETLGPEGLEPSDPRYIAAAEVLCAVAILPPGRVLAWVPGLPDEAGFSIQGPAGDKLPVEVMRRDEWLAALELGTDTVLIAHNAEGFDRRIWEAQGLPPATWCDTLPLCRRMGLPGSLDGACQRLFGAGKMGASTLERYTRLSRKMGATYDLFGPAEPGPLPPALADLLRQVVMYCVRDTVLVARLWAVVRDEQAGEAAVWAADREINARGWALDADFARDLLAMDAALSAYRREAVARLYPELEADSLRSRNKFLAWLRAHGVEAADATRDTLGALLDDPECPPDVALVLEARLQETRIGRAKLGRALALVESDGRIRRSLAYYAAATGRWGGRGMQPQNLPRAPKGLPKEAACLAVQERSIERFLDVSKKAGIEPSQVLAALLRRCIVAPPGHRLVIADYSQIEARVLLWLAGDTRTLATFASGDPYRALAAQLFGTASEAVTKEQRQLGKALTLGCGYGMGGTRFHAYAAGLGVSISEVEAVRYVREWRAARPRVTGLWSAYEAAFRAAIAGTATTTGAVRWHREGTAVVGTLPSGRWLWYWGAREEEEGSPSYLDSRAVSADGYRPRVWGGKLAENVVQAVARDLLADTLVRACEAGCVPVLHVHDEVVLEVSAQEAESWAARLGEWMREGPAWAAGLPIGVESRRSETYL